MEHGLGRPFLRAGADFVDQGAGAVIEHSRRDAALDPTWARFWGTQRGWKRDLHFHGAPTTPSPTCRSPCPSRAGG